MEVEDPFVHYQPPPAKPTPSKPKKPKMKSQPSVVDQLTPYDVSEDILKLQSTATVGQMLQYPNQRKNLVKILKRPKKTVETNYLQSENDTRKTSSAKCYVRIKGNPVIAILDSGAAVSIITNKLMYKLGLEPDTPSKTIVVTANGNRVRALGQITKSSNLYSRSDHSDQASSN